MATPDYQGVPFPEHLFLTDAYLDREIDDDAPFDDASYEIQHDPEKLDTKQDDIVAVYAFSHFARVRKSTILEVIPNKQPKKYRT